MNLKNAMPLAYVTAKHIKYTTFNFSKNHDVYRINKGN